MSVQPERRPFDVDEYHRMAEVGILTDEDRVELIDGEILTMSPIGHRHHYAVMFLTEALVRGLNGRAVVSPQGPIRLHRWTEPQPDVMLLQPPLTRYARGTAGPADALLIIEVADSSQYRDRVVKLPRYAAAGVREVWIVDVQAEAVEVYRDPSPKGYRDAGRAARGDRVAPEAFADLTLAVDDIFGPA